MSEYNLALDQAQNDLHGRWEKTRPTSIYTVPCPYLPCAPCPCTRVQHPPILLITDVMCHLAPIIDRRCPGLLENGGALPRIGDANEEQFRKVDIPSLAMRGTHTLDTEKRGEPVPESKCTQENVYDVFCGAVVVPGVQRGVDFGLLLRFCSEEVRWGTVGSSLAELARSELSTLHRNSRYSLDLYEVVVVLHHHMVGRKAEIQSRQGATTSLDAAEDEEENEPSEGSAVLGGLEERVRFSTSVLTAAVGSSDGQVPTLPDFYEGIRHPESRKLCSLEECIKAYAEVSAHVIAAVQKQSGLRKLKKQYWVILSKFIEKRCCFLRVRRLATGVHRN